MVQPGISWHRVNQEDFSFALPTELALVDGNAPDTHIVQYQGQDMIVTINEGVYAGEHLDSLSKYRNYTSDVDVIHGVGVQIVSFDIPPGPGHRFNYAIAASYRGLGLTMYIHCKSKDDYKTATKIFKTVKSKLL